jgi:hypothetical protein
MLADKLKLTEGSEYEKELKVHDWICSHVSYDENGADLSKPARVITSHNIIGVFAHHKAQCEGIAKAVKVLLNAADIKCIVAMGEATENGNTGPHAWNVVIIDNKPYQLDVTWDIGAAGRSKDRIFYDYFNITDEMMQKDHAPDYNLPICNAIDMDYFAQNRVSFRSRTRLLAYLKLAADSGKKEFYFRLEGKLSSAKTVKEIKELLQNSFLKKEQNSVKIQYRFNAEVGTCWIRIY